MFLTRESLLLCPCYEQYIGYWITLCWEFSALYPYSEFIHSHEGKSNENTRAHSSLIHFLLWLIFFFFFVMADFSFILLQTLELFFLKVALTILMQYKRLQSNVKTLKQKKLLGAKRTSLKFNGTYNQTLNSLYLFIYF